MIVGGILGNARGHDYCRARRAWLIALCAGVKLLKLVKREVKAVNPIWGAARALRQW